MKTKAEYSFKMDEEEYFLLLKLAQAGIFERKEWHKELIEENETTVSFEEFYAPEVRLFKEICYLNQVGRDEWYGMIKDGDLKEISMIMKDPLLP